MVLQDENITHYYHDDNNNEILYNTNLLSLSVVL